ncbi:MAG: class I SAM-dependent methyltransferase [Gammaproteobacteria bacterium]
MRIRESGMPEIAIWRNFFDAPLILDALGLSSDHQHVVEFGCGYGTFTVPAAKIIKGKLTAFEIDKKLLGFTQRALDAAGLINVTLLNEDFFSAVHLLGGACADYVMLFNILHGDDPAALFKQAHGLLVPGGTCGIIHWNYDPETPRGPPMEIRPQPETLATLAAQHGFSVSPMIKFPPYHYGYRLEKAPD